MAINLYEQQNRDRKVAKLLTHLVATHPVPLSREIASWTNTQWHEAETSANVKPCSEATRGEVVTQMRKFEDYHAARMEDPFRGIPVGTSAGSVR